MTQDKDKYEFDINDLSDNQRDIAELIGFENYVKLAEVYGGEDGIYIAKIDKLENAKRNRQIIDEFNGYNYQHLADKFDLSVRTIRNIIADFNQKPLKGQLSLFDNHEEKR